MTDQTTTPTVSEAQKRLLAEERSDFINAWCPDNALNETFVKELDALLALRSGLTAASQSRAPDQSERVRELEAEVAEARKVIEALIGTCGAPQVAIAARDWLSRNSESSNEK